jgi:hypothetical protein
MIVLAFTKSSEMNANPRKEVPLVESSLNIEVIDSLLPHSENRDVLQLTSASENDIGHSGFDTNSLFHSAVEPRLAISQRNLPKESRTNKLSNCLRDVNLHPCLSLMKHRPLPVTC